MSDAYSIQLDHSLCSGMGDCARLAPNVFEIGGDGIAVVTEGTASDPAALDAVRSCPMAALAAYRLSSGEQVA